MSIATQGSGDDIISMGLREADLFAVAVTTTAVRQKLVAVIAWQAGVAATVLPGAHAYLSAPPSSN